ncbi:MAG: 50S ribosomal protein L9 [candidate division Zixibacteria bacterium]|nr:50S ribosomal protein L9 [candidate division Zixibacteria bacterium]
MKVILKDNLEKLGDTGAVVNVKDGYARNYLFPHNLAIPATPSNLASIEHILREKKSRENKMLKESTGLKERLEQISCTADVVVGEEDKVFGSVTSKDIADMLKDKGFQIDKRKILMDEPIKSLGVFNVPVRLHPEVTASLKLWVVKREGKNTS